MSRVEVDADKRHVRVCSGENQRREPVPTAQFTVSRPGFGQVGPEAGKEQRCFEVAWGELRVESARVGRPNVIALPPVGHHSILDRDATSAAPTATDTFTSSPP